MTRTRRDILEQLASGGLSVAEATLLLASGAAESDRHDADLYPDLERAARSSLPEVVYCEGKTVAQIAAALNRLATAESPGFGTRCSPEKGGQLAAKDSLIDYDPVSQTVRRGAPVSLNESAAVAIVSAGTSDLPVATEIARTLESFGVPFERYGDVGVAGLHRLLSVLDAIRCAGAVVVVAGMEGALPSVVAGLVDRPIIAVPTSVGYGVADQGRTALFGMLASCAPGLTVVNIDNGFGAAAAALRIVRRGQLPRNTIEIEP